MRVSSPSEWGRQSRGDLFTVPYVALSTKTKTGAEARLGYSHQVPSPIDNHFYHNNREFVLSMYGQVIAIL